VAGGRGGRKGGNGGGGHPEWEREVSERNGSHED